MNIVQIVSVLLEYGADPDIEDEFMNVYTTARNLYIYIFTVIFSN